MSEIVERAPRTLKLCFPLGDDIDVMIHILGGVPTPEQFEQIRQHITLVEESLNQKTDPIQKFVEDKNETRKRYNWGPKATDEQRAYILANYPAKELGKELDLSEFTVNKILMKAGVEIISDRHCLPDYRAANGGSH